LHIHRQKLILFRLFKTFDLEIEQKPYQRENIKKRFFELSLTLKKLITYKKLSSYQTFLHFSGIVPIFFIFGQFVGIDC